MQVSFIKTNRYLLKILRAFSYVIFFISSHCLAQSVSDTYRCCTYYTKVEFKGVVTSVREDYDALNNQIIVGDSIRGSFIYDHGSIDTNSNRSIGNYVYKLKPNGIKATINNYTFESNPDTVVCKVMTLDDYFGYDVITFSSEKNKFNFDNKYHSGFEQTSIQVQLTQSSQAVLSNDHLPSYIDFSDWASASFGASGGKLMVNITVYFDIQAKITNVTSAIVNNDLLGIQSANNNKTLEIYPNPNNGGFHFHLNGKKDGALTYQVINVMGTEIIKAHVDVTDVFVDSTTLMPGIYYLKVSDGEAVSVKKFIVE